MKMRFIADSVVCYKTAETLRYTFIAVACVLFPLVIIASLPERDELFTRSYNGTYNITSTVESVVTGVGRVNLLLCVPYPESNRYQDIIWQKEIPPELISYYPETGRPYIRYARYERDQGTVRIERDFVVNLYKVKFDWSSVVELYPYNTSDDEYHTYTRRYPSDGEGYDDAYEWIVKQKNFIRAQCGNNDLEFIKGAYCAVTTNFTYGAASSTADSLTRKIGDCGRLSFAFISILREGGIPARMMVCLRPDSSPHVWSEFYLQNYGWIPADVTFDLGKSDNFNWFGENHDNCIVMTCDTGLTVSTAGGDEIKNVFVQGLAWWYWWWWEGNPDETSRSVNTQMSFGHIAGKLCDGGGFVSCDDIWRKWKARAVDEHSVFTFDATTADSRDSGYVIYNAGWCSYEPSPLGSAIRLDSNDGPWTTAELNLPRDWTVLSVLRSVDLDNASLFCLGSSAGDNCGLALASGGKDRVTLSYWEKGLPHKDLIVANVPHAAERYHAYAIRVRGKSVELFVDGIKADVAVLNAIPSYGLQFLGVIWGKGNTGLVMPVGGRIDDWRFCSMAVSDADIETYASILHEHNENLYKISFGKNGGTGGDAYVTATYGKPMPTPRNAPTKPGYVFEGYWDTTKEGGKQYYDANMKSVRNWDKTSATTLWAKWRKAAVVKVTFGKNGGTGGDNYVTATEGKPMPTPRTAPKRAGWTFGGYWDTLKMDAKGNPLGKQYYDANMKSVRNWDKSSAVTLWAKWTVRVTLGKNGGTGGDNYVTVTYNQPFPTRSMPKKSGYVFGGYWVSSSSRTGQCYNADGTGTSTMKWATGGTPTVWALWLSAKSASVLRGRATERPQLAEPGLYEGVLADGDGTFSLLLDEGLATAYLVVQTAEGDAAYECEVEVSDGEIVLVAEGGAVYRVAWRGGGLVAACY